MDKNNCKAIILAMFIRARLMEFLGLTDDYTGFKANLSSHHGRHPAHSVVWYLFWKFNAHSHCLENILPEVINDAFLWRDTPEGHEYWSHIDEAWRQYVRNMPLSESAMGYFGINTRE